MLYFIFLLNVENLILCNNNNNNFNGRLMDIAPNLHLGKCVIGKSDAIHSISVLSKFFIHILRDAGHNKFSGTTPISNN